MLTTIITAQVEYFNLVEKMTSAQLVETVNLFFIEYPNLTIEDVILCFRKAKTSQPGYDKPMSRVDGSLIFRWVNRYESEKLERIEEIRDAERQSHRDESKDPIAENVLVRIKEIIDAHQRPPNEKMRCRVKSVFRAQYERYAASLPTDNLIAIRAVLKPGDGELVRDVIDAELARR